MKTLALVLMFLASRAHAAPFVTGDDVAFGGSSSAAIWGMWVSSAPPPGQSWAWQTTDTTLTDVLNVYSATVPAKGLVYAATAGRRNSILKIHITLLSANSGTQSVAVYFGKTKIFAGQVAPQNAAPWVLDCEVRAINATNQWAQCLPIASANGLGTTTPDSGPFTPAETLTAAVPITVGLSTNVSPFRMAGIDISVTSQ